MQSLGTKPGQLAGLSVGEKVKKEPVKNSLKDNLPQLINMTFIKNSKLKIKQRLLFIMRMILEVKRKDPGSLNLLNTLLLGAWLYISP